MKLNITILALALSSTMLGDTREAMSPAIQEKSASFETVEIAPQYLSEIRVMIRPGSPAIVIMSGEYRFSLQDHILGVDSSKDRGGQNLLAVNFAESLRRAKSLKLLILKKADSPDPKAAEVVSLELVY